jgi:hypothetical protein
VKVSDGWPTQARFWLEWGCSHVTDLVRPNKLDCPHAVGTKPAQDREHKTGHHKTGKPGTDGWGGPNLSAAKLGERPVCPTISAPVKPPRVGHPVSC